ncbi:hypothetical protein BVG79_01869 [Ketogulonicigenium robustum]|uniref:Uncharacterized protein n=1 Tax=Ketogulonicigenium robustum TaxID=92947 RepID=A0A1W6P1D7_9RHOB|nr:hypothetical protein BVG79_01869 [Ketogulonicigenium robustum]
MRAIVAPLQEGHVDARPVRGKPQGILINQPRRRGPPEGLK